MHDERFQQRDDQNINQVSGTSIVDRMDEYRIGRNERLPMVERQQPIYLTRPMNQLSVTGSGKIQAAEVIITSKSDMGRIFSIPTSI